MSEPLFENLESPTPASDSVADVLVAKSTLTDELGAGRVLAWARFVAVAMSITLVGVVVRVGFLQTQPAPQVAPLLGTQKARVFMQGRRGNIIDRRGRILATTGLAYLLYADPKRIEDPVTFPEYLGYTLNYDPAEIQKRLYKLRDKRYVVLDKKLTEERLSRLGALQEERQMKGLYTDLWLERRYPLGPVLGQVIGFVGREGHGFEGAERMYDRGLTGASGKLGYVVDAAGRPLGLVPEGFDAPRDGQTLRLSIDVFIQMVAEEELARACEEFGAETAEMVVMDPHTGEILAMVNYPPFDPNEYRTTDPKHRRNRCVTDPFEPGSTFKSFLWAAGVEGGYVTPETIIDTGQSVGRRLRDTHSHGSISWAKVLIKSSNKGMAVVGRKMGNRNIYNAVRAFGFGDLSHSGIPGESRGLVNPLHSWSKVYSPTSVPMGQEIGVTPIQLCRAFCVFANGGFMVNPTIRARDAQNPDDPRNTAIVERVISHRTATITRDVLRRVVTEGTGRKSNSKLYSLFGKTGTAQVARTDGRGYEPGAYTSAFLAGAPYESPRLVVASVVHKPTKKSYYGGIVAAPAAMRVIERSLTYMGVKNNKQRDREGDRLVSRDVVGNDGLTDWVDQPWTVTQDTATP